MMYMRDPNSRDSSIGLDLHCLDEALLRIRLIDADVF